VLVFNEDAGLHKYVPPDGNPLAERSEDPSILIVLKVENIDTVGAIPVTSHMQDIGFQEAVS
jgi:hypothetical protein